MLDFVLAYLVFGGLFYLFCDAVFKNEQGVSLSAPAALFLIFLWPVVLGIWAYMAITGKGFDDA